MEIIRGRLSAADFSNPSLRYNPDTDAVEYSPDGGATWNPDPADDPRVGLKFLKALKTGTEIKCRSAASTVKWLRDFIEYEASIMTLGAGVTAIGNAFLTLLSPIAPYAVLIAILFDGAETLFTIGATALTAAFDEDTWATLLCIVYCNVAADGSVSDARFEDIQTAITSDLNTTAALVLNLILQTQGRVGFQNSGTLYEVDDADCGDCTDCDRCYTWYFDDGDGGWYPRTAGEGNYTGAAWVATYYAPDAGKLVVIEHDIPTGAIIKSLSPDFAYVLGSTGGCPAGETRGAFLRYLNSSGDYIEAITSDLPLSTGDYPNTIKLTSENTPVKIQVNIWCAQCDHTDGAVTINSVTITGRWSDGDFPPDNC